MYIRTARGVNIRLSKEERGHPTLDLIRRRPQNGAGAIGSVAFRRTWLAGTAACATGAAFCAFLCSCFFLMHEDGGAGVPACRFDLFCVPASLPPRFGWSAEPKAKSACR